MRMRAAREVQMRQNYQKNNILFRIASADALGKFKSAQANAFLQLVRKELSFNQSARETVLLEYDRLSQWLLRLEKVYLLHNQKNVSLSLRNETYETFVGELSSIEFTMSEHTDVFCAEVSEYIHLVHSYAKKIMHHLLQGCFNVATPDAFAKVVGTATLYLEHVLLSMHEFNNNSLRKSKQPFLTISDFCNSEIFLGSATSQCHIKAEFFARFLRKSDSTFILKNFCNNSQIDFSDIQEYLSARGVTIIEEKQDEPVSSY